MTRCTVHTNDASPCLRNTAGETKGGSLLRRAWKQSTCKGYKTNILLGNRFIVNRGKTESQMKQQTYQWFHIELRNILENGFWVTKDQKKLHNPHASCIHSPLFPWREKSSPVPECNIRGGQQINSVAKERLQQATYIIIFISKNINLWTSV